MKTKIEANMYTGNCSIFRTFYFSFIKEIFKPGYCPDVEPQPIGTPGAIPCGNHCKNDFNCHRD